MPDLLLELFSEEIPARMQAQAAEDLQAARHRRAGRARLDSTRAPQSFATPRRLALHIAGLPARQPDTREERKGPRVGAPDGGDQGFLKSAGLASIEARRSSRTPRRASSTSPSSSGRAAPTREVLAEILPAIIESFPWPKSMRWGAASTRPDALRWVRPLHAILCTFGRTDETPRSCRSRRRDRAGDIDLRPSLHGAGRDHGAPLRRLCRRRWEGESRARRRAAQATSSCTTRAILALAQGLELVEDEGLLEEVAGLVEWPVVLMGAFDEEFLEIPPEVIRATIRANQKCFVLRDPRQGRLANSSSSSPISRRSDGGAAIAAGNERVMRARLSDARHFWRDRSRAAARLQGQGGQAARTAARQAEGAQHRLPREARHAGRARRAHRGAGEGARADGRRRRRTWPSAPRSSPRPISSPRWSASSPNCRA